MSDKDNQEGNNNIAGKVLAGAAIVGAGVVAAKVLSDPENREKIKDGVNNLKEKGSEAMENLKDDTVQSLTDAFEELRSRIDSSPRAQELSGKIVMISDKLAEIKNSNQDDVKDLISNVKGQIEDLSREFDSNASKDQMN